MFRFFVERVFLRPLTKNDVNEYYLSWFNDEQVTKFLEVRGSSLTKQIIIDYIKYGIKTKSYYMYAICLFENKKHIGNLKIGPIDHKHNLSDFITVIGDKSQWGKGLATEAIKLGIKLAFDKYKIRKLSAGISSDNVGSIKAYTNAGFVIEGILKNHYFFNDKYQDRVMVSCFNSHYKYTRITSKF